MLVSERQQRVEPLRRRLDELEVDALLVTTPANIRYLSGFTGSLSYLLIGLQAAEILGDSRYWVQMEEEATGFTLSRSRLSSDLLGVVPERVTALGFKRVGFEAQNLTIGAHESLRAALPDGTELRATTGMVEELRMRKHPEEIERLRAAATIASRAFDRVAAGIRPGMRELDAAFLLEQTFRELGADGTAFETIVAGGPRGALPHGRASDRVLEGGDMVVIDFGACAGGYNSDITRTIVLGEPNRDQLRALHAVEAGQAASLERMRPGVAASEVDRVARATVTEAVGPAACFGHGLGHGIGLDVHERPTLSQRDQTILQSGMVITNEPGVYIAGWGGVRLEEMVLITEAGPEVITPATRRVAVAG